MTKHIVIIGATSSIAHHCARLWAKQGNIKFTLVGRNKAGLKRIADDITARGQNITTTIETPDFLDVKSIDKTINKIQKSGAIDIALIAHGLLSEQETCQNNLQATDESIKINALSPALFAESLAKIFAIQSYGTLGIIGSVAGDRGRKANYTYGASKALLETMASGMQQRFTNTNVNIVLIKPGPTTTPMTAHLNNDKMAKPENVAAHIIQGLKYGKSVIYTPKKWWFIMTIVKNIPKFIFNKMNF